jgi:hypothetical protein
MDKFYEVERAKQIANLTEWAAEAPPAIANRQRIEIAKIRAMTIKEYRRYAISN